MSKQLLSFIAIGSSLVLAGCTLAPEYERPASPVSGQWPKGLDAAEDKGGEIAADLNWRTFYQDARLQQVIALALENNRDLRIAVLNVELVRAQYGIQRSNLLPTLSGNGSWSRQHTPGDLTGTGVGATGNTFNLGVGVTSYEVDLFGRIRSLNRQALENYLASEEARKSTQIALIAEVANQYLAERATYERLVVSEQTLKTVSDSLELIQSRYDIGDATRLDLRTAQSQVESARASVATYQEQWAIARNGLTLLVGTELPANLPPVSPLSDTHLLGDLQAGLPSDLLIRRPDILAAEHRLIGANANIGAARAAFFPSIYLTASGGTASAQLSDLFSSGSGAWQFMPTISVPIFTGGRNTAALEAAKVGKNIEIAQYEQVIQNAFREVSDSLATREWIGQRLEAYQKLVEAQQERFDLATERYERGVDNYLSVLVAQQELFNAQQNLIATEQLRLSNMVTLYKVLGGGWDEQDAAVADAAASGKSATVASGSESSAAGEGSESELLASGAQDGRGDAATAKTGTAPRRSSGPDTDDWGVWGTGN